MKDLEQTGLYQPNGSTSPTVDAALPERIGRYRVEKLLGEGGFGLVYLAHDEQLQRLVAIKVPHHDRVSTTKDAEAYLTEARMAAKLDHPRIVSVFDVGSTEDFPCFIVSKFIEGTDLATRLKQSWYSIHESVELVATVAEALHHAHIQGLVHRDIKPGNILLDNSGKPFVADFGLALREQDVGKGPRFAGTPAYMSPEQANGEGHRVDGRSDIFSLGVVFYELLTGRRPFKADALEELLTQITTVDVRPPRQYDDAIPREIERICLKALSRRPTERYTTAKDLADDLRHFQAQQITSMAKGDALPAVTPTVQNVPQQEETLSRNASITHGKRKRGKRWAGLIVATSILTVAAVFVYIQLVSLIDPSRTSKQKHPETAFPPEQTPPPGSAHGNLDGEANNKWQDEQLSYLPSTDVAVSRIRLDTDACLWKNLYDSEEIAGFEEDKIYVRNKWRGAKWVSEEDDRKLRTVFSYMQRQSLEGSNPQVPDALQGPYESFLGIVVPDYRLRDQRGKLFRFLHTIWPSRQTMQELRKQDDETYLALHDFEMDFFRDKHPIFDVILENKSPQDVVLHSALLHMRNVTVDRRLKSAVGGAAVLEVAAEYEWKLTNYDDPLFREWLARKFAVDSFTQELQPSRFELDPPLILEGKKPVRIRIRFLEGYSLSCEIKFGFVHNENTIVTSKWYSFHPD